VDMCSPVEGGLAGIVALPVLATATSNVRHIPYVSITALAEAGYARHLACWTSTRLVTIPEDSP